MDYLDDWATNLCFWFGLLVCWFTGLLLVSGDDTSVGGDVCDGVEVWCRSEGLHSARPRVMRRKAVAIVWLGPDTDYG